MPRARFFLLLLSAMISVECGGEVEGLGGAQEDQESFRECIVSQPQRTLTHCLGMGAISKLQSLDSDPELDLIDGVTFTRDQKEYRDAYNYAERDPADYRNWFDSLGHVFAHRTMLWDMDFLYPGLGMRMTPSVSPGGTLEFVLDPRKEAFNKQQQHSLKEIGTGRLLARQFFVPFLLGLKFNVSTLFPLLFALLALLAKKAVVVSKLGLIITSAYALGTLLLGNANKIPTQNYNHQHGYGTQINPGFGGHYNRFPSTEYQDPLYRANNLDQLRLYNTQEEYVREGTGRNFAWTEAQKANNK